MNDDRREFLKKAGKSSLLGIGVISAYNFVKVNKGEASEVFSDDNASGTRWGMVIDTKKCPGTCNACIDICNKVHNIPQIDDTDEEIKWIWKDKFENVFPSKSHQFMNSNVKNKFYTVLCNHCKNPPCVRVCPTKATFKRADGIVAMDFHRCIGCRFCMAGCPYGSRSFNWRDPRPHIKEINPDFPTRERGVVEKCNFCAERLAEGKIPACVESCVEKAMIFGNINNPNSEIRNVLNSNTFIQRKSELGTQPSVFYIV